MAGALKGTLTLCLALWLTSIAWGQGQQPKATGNEILGPTLSNPEVQKELKLSDEQISKLKDALGKVGEKYNEDFAKFRRMSPEELQKNQEELQKKIKDLMRDGRKAIAGILDAKQMKRFKQIEWQRAGIGALQDPDLQKDLKLSDEQKKKLDGIFNDANKKWQQMQRSRETSPEKYQAVLKDLEEKANGVLSEEQKKDLKELKGPAFQPPPPSTPKR